MKGRIYKIVCNETGLQYVGATKQTLCNRLSTHKYYFKKGSTRTTSWIVLQSGNYNILLIEEIEYETKDQLHQRERHWIEALDCVNKVIPYRTDEEKQQWRSNNKELLRQLWDSWYERNKDRLKEKVKCECGCEVSKRHLKEHLETDVHKLNMLSDEEKQKLEDEKKEQQRKYKAEWHQKNKERNIARMKERYERIKNDPEQWEKYREDNRKHARKYQAKKREEKQS